ncbi:MAG: SRPBCC domain-containing protein [Planctomycetales bacterium]|nr:SRPBCC domain-containing protein [Planctomycetales bacterium]
MVARNNPREIYLVREYDAPIDAVWEAWTDVEQVAKWWGPRGFTLTTHSKDLRPGGIWHYTMHGPDGVDYPNKTLYHEVVEREKLVYDHGGYDDRPPLFRVTVNFSEVDGKTNMEMSMVLPTAEEAEATRKFIKEVGGFSTWDRLAEYLSETENGKNCFVINRSFEAPIEQVFEMWTNPEHLANWLPPSGMKMTWLRKELFENGSCFFSMSNGEDFTLYAQFQFVEINQPNRVVYLQRFCDANENITCHPAMETFPSELRTTVLLAAECQQSTRVTVISETLENVIESELGAFRQARTGMTQGWTGSFDKLEDLLRTDSEDNS